MAEIKTIDSFDVLIVGTGPAGSTAALTLAKLGVRVLVVNKFGWTARTPRAHITNPRTIEVLHDLGVYEHALLHAVPNTLMGENTFCTSLAGMELGRIRAWGTNPDQAHNYAIASPETNHDIPQNLLEPVLLGAAARHDAAVQFHTELVTYEQDEQGVTATLRNLVSGEEYCVRTRYLIGADGANSRVAEIAGLPFEGMHGKEGNMNIVFEADLSRFVAHRPSVLFWMMRSGADAEGPGVGVMRMVRPWHKWLAIWGYDVKGGQPDIDDAKAVQIIHKLIGDDSVPVKIESVSFWTVNEVWATRLSEKRVFCMGDAVHRHPPTKGLGSNTSIQDAFNLGWKMAMVLRGVAGPGLLDSYSVERAPIAEQIVKGANRGLSTLFRLMGATGLDKVKTPEQMHQALASFGDGTPEAADRRDLLTQAVAGTRDVFDNPGIELQHRYVSGAVSADGQVDPGYRGDPEVFFEPTTYPGARLPHAWVTRNGQRTSLLYLCGQGRFTILTGISGCAWRDAASAVAARLGVEIDVVVIGLLQPVEDSYGDFARVRETDESGAILVRPDHHVGWRTKSWGDAGKEDLEAALRKILAL